MLCRDAIFRVRPSAFIRIYSRIRDIFGRAFARPYSRGTARVPSRHDAQPGVRRQLALYSLPSVVMEERNHVERIS